MRAGDGGVAAAASAPLPPFTVEHEDFREVARRFVDRELRPHVEEWEAAGCVPRELFRRCGELGFIGLRLPERWGGSDDPIAASVFAEELGRCGSGGVAASIGAHAGIATPPVAVFGTDEQCERWVAPAIRGELVGALAITEPDAGSDVAALKTTAERVDGGWVLNGSKTYITNGVFADFLVTAVRTRPEGGHAGMSFLVVERGRGVESHALQKLGWHASDTGLIHFDDVFVPEDNLLGELDRGFYLIMANFQWERLGMALSALGQMQDAFERTLEFVNERRAFGRTIGSFQVSRHRLAECATTIEAGRAITFHALRRFLDGGDAVREVTMAKLITQRGAVDVIDACLQLHGGAGYMAEYGIERMLRDARLGPIGGGTDEVMKEILGKQMGL